MDVRIEEFRALLPATLNFGVTPVEAKEIVYQAVAYLGIGRVFPFLHTVNDVLTARELSCPWKVRLPLLLQTVWRWGLKYRLTFLVKS